MKEDLFFFLVPLIQKSLSETPVGALTVRPVVSAEHGDNVSWTNE